MLRQITKTTWKEPPGTAQSAETWGNFMPPQSVENDDEPWT